MEGVSDSRVYAYYSNYKPSGAVGQVSHVNGTTDYRYYDPFTMRITSIRTTSILGDLQYWSYGYTPAGDIEEIHNIVTDVTYDYTYDELHRLLSETSDGAYPTVNYTYNAIGNIMSKTYGANSYAYTYDTTRKHAVANINFNGNNYAYTYDGSGTRVKKAIQGGSTTWYIGSHYEKKDSTYTKYIFAGGTRIAKVTTSGYHILHSDHLGSSTVISDSSGAIAESTEYNPFGTTRTHSGATLTNYKYTDQERDPETGLYNYGARYYDPMIGRFISPDSIVQAPFNPQSLNRYSYCINNPLMYVDPSGNFWGFFIGAFIGAFISGIESDWSFGAMLAGGIIGGLSGAIGFETGAWAFEAAGRGPAGIVAAGAAGGGAAGATSGGLFAAVYGGNILEGTIKGAALGAIGGTVTGGLIACGFPSNSIAAGLGGFTSGYIGGGEDCAFKGALYAFAADVALMALRFNGAETLIRETAAKIRAENPNARLLLQGNSLKQKLMQWLGFGNHTAAITDVDLPYGSKYLVIENNGSYFDPKDPYYSKHEKEYGFNYDYSVFSFNPHYCSTRFGYSSPMNYYSNFHYAGTLGYWWWGSE